MNERDFFTEKTEMKPMSLSCPHCRHRADYQIKWLHRTKKERVPPGADERDRAIFAKVRDHLYRMLTTWSTARSAGVDSRFRPTRRWCFCEHADLQYMRCRRSFHRSCAGAVSLVSGAPSACAPVSRFLRNGIATTRYNELTAANTSRVIVISGAGQTMSIQAK